MEPEQIENKGFLVGLRGYDREEVDRFLKEVAEVVRELHRQTSEMPAPSAPAGPKDAYRQLGEETSRILVVAEEAAEEIRAKAEAQAAEVTSKARAEAEVIRERSLDERKRAEAHLQDLERSRAALVTQLEDVRRRLDETVNRMKIPMRQATRPAPETVTEEQEPSSPREAPPEPAPEVHAAAEVAEEPATSEPSEAPVVEEPPPTPSPASARPLEDMLDEIRKEREEGRREVQEALRAAGIDETEAADQAPVIPAPITALPERDQALGDLPRTASDRLKAAFQEDQNDLLDKIRTGRDIEDLSGLISESEQSGRFLVGVGAALQDAYRAGAKVVNEDSTVQAGEGIGELVSKQVVHPLRADLGAVLAAGIEKSEGPSALSHRASDVYRVWKGVRTETLGEGLVLAAYHLGMTDAAGPDARKVWILAEEENCPGACRENASGEPLRVQARFPSGHRMPPAHGGCFCGLRIDG